MVYKQSLTVAVLIATTAVSGLPLRSSIAQPVKSSELPAGTQVQISDSSQMAPINQALMQSFEQNYPNVAVVTQSSEAANSLEALLAGQTDLASISRPLTEDERGQGLIQVPVTREKIAIVVGADNPFRESLTIEQVNQIMAGEITDWEQVGGPSGAIRIVQRSPTSNAAQALQRYPNLRTTLAGQDEGQSPVEIDDLAAALGNDGVSFALASELSSRSQMRALPMYGQLPGDARYPFSQPFTYVYKKGASAKIQTFLGFVASATGQAAVSDAIANPQDFPTTSTEASPASSPTPSPDSSASDNSTTSADSEGQGEDLFSQLDWLPLVLALLGLGLLALAVWRATAARRKQQSVPRPAPNYSERVRTEEPTATEVDGEISELDPDLELSTQMLESRRRDDVVPEFAEFNTQMQVAATRLQLSDEDGDNTQLQTPTTQLQASEEEPEQSDASDAEEPTTQLQDGSSQDGDSDLPGPTTQLQDPSVTKLQDSDPWDS